MRKQQRSIVWVLLIAMLLAAPWVAQAQDEWFDTFRNDHILIQFPDVWRFSQNENNVVFANSQAALDATLSNQTLQRGMASIIVFHSAQPLLEAANLTWREDYTPRQVLEQWNYPRIRTSQIYGRAVAYVQGETDQNTTILYAIDFDRTQGRTR
jgi:hypothetical protein